MSYRSVKRGELLQIRAVSLLLYSLALQSVPRDFLGENDDK